MEISADVEFIFVILTFLRVSTSYVFLNLKGPDGCPRKTKVVDDGDGTHKATYVPDDVGNYKVTVKYAGQEVPQSPINVNAVPTGQADKCKITGELIMTVYFIVLCCLAWFPTAAYGCNVNGLR